MILLTILVFILCLALVPGFFDGMLMIVFTGLAIVLAFGAVFLVLMAVA